MDFLSFLISTNMKFWMHSYLWLFKNQVYFEYVSLWLIHLGPRLKQEISQVPAFRA